VLTGASIKAASTASKPKNYSMAGGLRALISPNGTKLWCLKHRFGGVETADDSISQQARENVEAALAARGLLEHHRHEV